MIMHAIPARNVINVFLLGEDIDALAYINILNTDSELVYSVQSRSAKYVKINVSKLPTGMYTLQIIQQEKTTNRLITICR